MKKINSNFILAVVIAVLSGGGLAFGFAGGDGSEANPWQISTKDDLVAVNNDLFAHYILVNDIDLAGQIYTTAIIAPDVDPATSFFQGTRFSGIFDGNGYVINNLTIDTAGADNDYLGLFGWIYDFDAKVKNLGIQNCTITGGNDSDYLGGLCGYSSGSITTCFSTGVISGGIDSIYLGGLAGMNNYGSISGCYAMGAVTGGSSVGGLAGAKWNPGSVISDSYATGMVNGTTKVGGLCGDSFNGNITHCYATGSVSGDSNVGGLVGQNFGLTTTDCYATGAVTGGDNSSLLGGLCGNNDSDISNCYATGAVTGGDNSSTLGGLCGYDRSTAGDITNCYAAGAVSGGIGSTYLGGLMGRSGASPYGGYDISGCFWNTQISGLDVAYTFQFMNDFTPVYSTVGIVEGRTTTEMMTQSTFTDWDFVNDWKMLRENEDYPRLVWQEEFIGDIAGLYGVNSVDYAELAAHWGQTGCPTGCEDADINGDGTVGIADLALLADNWLGGI